jgi:hypothetical protein
VVDIMGSLDVEYRELIDRQEAEIVSAAGDVTVH